MTLDWLHFTPWTALAGGALIGLAAGALMAFNGRIAGVSGIAGGLWRNVAGDRAWRLAFLLGLVAAPMIAAAFAWRPVVRIDASWGTLVVAGLLVGVGTRYGAGCTSGHGVCGLSRFSGRSAVATVVFIAAGVATVALLRHGLAK